MYHPIPSSACTTIPSLHTTESKSNVLSLPKEEKKRHFCSVPRGHKVVPSPENRLRHHHNDDIFARRPVLTSFRPSSSL